MDRRVDQHGLPIPQGFDDEPPRARRSGGMPRLVRLALVLVVVGAVVTGMWYSPLGDNARLTIGETFVTSATDKYQRGEPEGALADIDTALTWSPQIPDAYYLRARVLLSQRRAEEALEAANQLIEMSPDFGPGYGIRGEVLMQLKRYQEAIADLSEYVRRSPDDSTEPLNNRAYARALGNVELEAALNDIQRAIKLSGSSPPAAYLDTRGYIYYLLDRYEEALEDLDRAVRLAEELQASTLGRPEFKQLGPQQQNWIRGQLDEMLGVLLYHRGLANQALDHEQEAKADFGRAAALGYSIQDDAI